MDVGWVWKNFRHFSRGSPVCSGEQNESRLVQAAGFNWNCIVRAIR